MKRLTMLGLLLAAACTIFGCTNPDSRLNGSWSGDEYFLGFRGDKINVTFDNGNGSYDGSTNYVIAYETKRKLILSSEITWTEDGETTTGLYKFEGGDAEKLYLSIDAASALSLEPSIGPVWVLEKTPATEASISTWDKLLSLGSALVSLVSD